MALEPGPTGPGPASDCYPARPRTPCLRPAQLLTPSSTALILGCRFPQPASGIGGCAPSARARRAVRPAQRSGPGRPSQGPVPVLPGPRQVPLRQAKLRRRCRGVRGPRRAGVGPGHASAVEGSPAVCYLDDIHGTLAGTVIMMPKVVSKSVGTCAAGPCTDSAADPPQGLYYKLDLVQCQ